MRRLANGGVLGGGLGLLAIGGGLVAGSWFAGEARQEALAVGTACAAVVVNSALVAGVFLGREAFVRYNLALVFPPLFALAAIAAAFFVFGQRTPSAALWRVRWRLVLAAIAVLLLSGGASGLWGARRSRRRWRPRSGVFCAAGRGGERDFVPELPRGPVRGLRHFGRAKRAWRCTRSRCTWRSRCGR
ncbi:hypothetical protein O0235_09485 [Tepidiforma flava]|uniref:Uncharacterized protein n=1 Tax=Tepidiforma flava TaxID=3004094 RepID=A0ABY7M2Z3_9CHLR|nr:hypothetical protein [Tepidiforma flava]WBL35018.1 hypothetical protein O0235_09485 [Tepidiforma flava]